MPVPKPKSGESKDDFLDRCMGDDKMVDEYEQDQRYAICMSKWEDKNESKDGEDKLKTILEKLNQEV
jgi:hypothetical protein